MSCSLEKTTMSHVLQRQNNMFCSLQETKQHVACLADFRRQNNMSCSLEKTKQHAFITGPECQKIVFIRLKQVC